MTRQEYVSRISELQEQISAYRAGNPPDGFHYVKANQELLKLKRGISLVKKREAGSGSEA